MSCWSLLKSEYLLVTVIFCDWKLKLINHIMIMHFIQLLYNEKSIYYPITCHYSVLTAAFLC